MAPFGVNQKHAGFVCVSLNANEVLFPVPLSLLKISIWIYYHLYRSHAHVTL